MNKNSISNENSLINLITDLIQLNSLVSVKKTNGKFTLIGRFTDIKKENNDYVAYFNFSINQPNVSIFLKDIFEIKIYQLVEIVNIDLQNNYTPNFDKPNDSSNSSNLSKSLKSNDISSKSTSPRSDSNTSHLRLVK